MGTRTIFSFMTGTFLILMTSLITGTLTILTTSTGTLTSLMTSTGTRTSLMTSLTTGTLTPPGADMKPGQTDGPMVPINKMVPRSFLTNFHSGDTVSAGAPLLLRGIAFGGDSGVARVDVSTDGGKTWRPAELGKDEGKYGFRQWQAQPTPPGPGKYSVMVRCTNENGVVQPDTPNWNPGGYMRNIIESTDLVAA